MKERIGIMGGMFDPVHIGHIRVASAALQNLQLDQVKLIPCGIPNHRDEALCSSLQRLDMLRLAVREHPGLVVDERELNRPGKSYTYDTLLSLRVDYPASALFFILGEDAFAALEGWHRWRELFELSHFVIIERPGFDGEPGEALRKELADRLVADCSEMKGIKSGLICRVKGLENPISSSMVREHIARDQALDQLLDPAVIAYLAEHQLYRKAVTGH